MSALTPSGHPTISIANPAAVDAAAIFSATRRSHGTSMANTKSAKKATRKIAHRTEVNKARRSRMRSSLRVVEDAIAKGDKTAAKAALVAAEPALMRAARNGIVHKKSASRKVSRLTQRIAKLG
jgi:small subunit ribosomal protein S20